MNPLNLFTDLIPAKVRLWIYATAALLLFGYSLWLAVEGDWLQFAVALVTALGSSMAGGNVNTEPDYTEYDQEV